MLIWSQNPRVSYRRGRCQRPRPSPFPHWMTLMTHVDGAVSIFPSFHIRGLFLILQTAGHRHDDPRLAKASSLRSVSRSPALCTVCRASVPVGRFPPAHSACDDSLILPFHTIGSNPTSSCLRQVSHNCQNLPRQCRISGAMCMEQ